MDPGYHETAGGVVINDRGELLVLVRDIKREGGMRHEVRLPKGHIDPGEDAETAAMREVCEESGYCALDIVADLGTYRSEYELRGEAHVRDEQYYLMRLKHERRQPTAHVNEEEALFSVEWVPAAEASQRITYRSEQIFADRALEAWRMLKEKAGT